MSSSEDEVQRGQRIMRGISEELGRNRGAVDMEPPSGTPADVPPAKANSRRAAEEDVPPGPWRWQGVSPEPSDRGNERGRDEFQGEALVDAEGTWLVWADSGAGFPDVNPDARELLAKAWLLERLPELFDLWDACRDTETPAEREAALVAFDSAITHLRSAYGEGPDSRWR